MFFPHLGITGAIILFYGIATAGGRDDENTDKLPYNLNFDSIYSSSIEPWAPYLLSGFSNPPCLFPVEALLVD